jgi:hypothetical protein
MKANDTTLAFKQIHIEVARNATDDFNIFHDKNKWQGIQNNPFGGPIALGFQLESLIENQMRLYRDAHNEWGIINENKLRFSNYQFTFASAVTCGQHIEVDIKKSRLSPAESPVLSNRVCLKADGKIALLGHKRESQSPLFLPEASFSELGDLYQLPDRSVIPGHKLFLKRKFMNNSNAKNFLTASLSEQVYYFDELNDRVQYPEIFPCGLISCALLEEAIVNNHNFERNPMVYSSHKISVDRLHLDALRSNDRLDILVRRSEEALSTLNYECFGLVGGGNLLFRALIALVPLDRIGKS